MTEVRTFKASSMQEALELVRRELGPDAVILHTRQVTRRRLLPWKQRQEVEITAGVDVNVRPPSARARRPPGPTARARTLHPPTALESTHPPGPNESPTGGLNGRTAVGVNDVGVDLTTAPLSEPQQQAAAIWSVLQQRNAQSASGPPSQTETKPQPAVPAAPTTPDLAAGAAGPPAAPSTVELAARLDSIQAMVEQLTRSAQLHRHEEVPPELFHLYTRLIDSDVEDELAREMIFRVRQSGTAEQLADADAAMSLLAAMIQSEIQCSGPITPRAGTRRVVALVGPTGVGKTTTIAKLAANFRLRDGIKMGLVTVDTYRIAAVEQLRTYAEIIDLPMKVVTSPLEMRRALEELVGLDLVLIDTAGRSPKDDLKIQELKTLLSEAEVDEVHLVLSMTASSRSLVATAERFAPANITSLILTKLDEAAEMGTLLSVARKIPKPISYLTTGQDVPDDIEPARPERIARLILGLDHVGD